METGSRTDLHPEVAADLERKRAGGGLIGKDQLSIAESRRRKVASVEALGVLDDPEPVETVRDLEIPGPGSGLAIRTYRPSGEGPLPVLVWFHGGGWIRSGIDAVDPMCRALANAVGCLVISAGYRLAPEHPFPAAVDDAYAATTWAAENAAALGGGPERLAVGGKSAGGTLAAAVSMLARDRDGPAVTHQVLGCPALDSTLSGASYRENVGYGLDPADLQFCWDQYLGRRIHGRNPYASPLHARDLSGLPPAVVVTAGYDVLRDDGVRYVERLEESGVDATHHHYPDMNHGLLGASYFVGGIGRAPEAVDAMAAELRGAFGTE